MPTQALPDADAREALLLGRLLGAGTAELGVPQVEELVRCVGKRMSGHCDAAGEIFKIIFFFLNAFAGNFSILGA